MVIPAIWFKDGLYKISKNYGSGFGQLYFCQVLD
jgi:hypothetical protein